MPRLCPCGRRLVQKPKERSAAFEKRKYCDTRCRTKYFKPAPQAKVLGIQVPRNKVSTRVGTGLINYLYSRPV